MLNLTKLATLLLVAASPAALSAQNASGNTAASGDAAKAAPQLSPEEVANYQRGARIMRAFTAAWTSDEVSTAVKGRLISCLYNNKLETIATATGRVFSNSPNLDPTSPTDTYRVAAGVCGITFRRVAPGGEGASDTAPATGATGR